MNSSASVLLFTNDRAEEAGWLSALQKETGGVSLCVSDTRQNIGAGPLPELIVLDLDLLDGSALETLKWVRSQSLYAQIPVIAVTAAKKPAEIELAYRLGINSCLIKPLCSDDQDGIARGIRSYAALLHASVVPALLN